MGILSCTSLISFEISNKCNLQNCHPECPINKRKYRFQLKHLNTRSIVNTIEKAVSLGFNGLVAFHYYNEPLLNLELITDVIHRLPKQRYLLWTNGTLLDRKIENNRFLKKFEKVCITCYKKDDMYFFEQLKDFYRNIEIFDWELDDRLDIYEKKIANDLSCKRPLFEIPIDYYGNIHLCCMDWNNQYEIGNIFEKDFINIINSEQYQRLQDMCKNRLLDKSFCPEICKTCDKVWVFYPHYYDI